jgi:hypothetical protein
VAKSAFLRNAYCGEAGSRAEPQVSGARRSRQGECSAAVGSGATKSKTKTKGTLTRPLSFDVKASYFFLAFFFAFFLVAMFLFSLSIFHGCAVLSKKPQLMNV